MDANLISAGGAEQSTLALLARGDDRLGACCGGLPDSPSGDGPAQIGVETLQVPPPQRQPVRFQELDQELAGVPYEP